MKVCPRCQKRLPANSFGKDASSKDGRKCYCSTCNRAYMAAHRNKNREALRAAQRRYYFKNKAKCYATNRKWTVANRPKMRVAISRWAKANREHIAAYARYRRATNTIVNLRNRITPRIRRLVLGKCAGVRTQDLLGFTHAELKSHLIKKFKKGMTWAALMRGEIHIDHVVPLSALGIDSVEHPLFKHAWGLNNLQPLWAKDNVTKSNALPKRLPKWYTDYFGDKK